MRARAEAVFGTSPSGAPRDLSMPRALAKPPIYVAASRNSFCGKRRIHLAIKKHSPRIHAQDARRI